MIFIFYNFQVNEIPNDKGESKKEKGNPPTQRKARRIVLRRDKREKGRLGTRSKNQFVKFVEEKGKSQITNYKLQITNSFLLMKIRSIRVIRVLFFDHQISKSP